MNSTATLPTRTCTRAQRIIARCREIATVTDIAGQTTRTFLSPATHAVHDLLRAWTQAAGMETRIDPAGNLRALRRSPWPNAPCLVLGSHLDTVPNAGAFDGVLGVALAISAVEELAPDLPMEIEILGFSEEEGVRFRKPFFGSMALAGTADAMLDLTDADGITLAQAIRNFGLDPSRLREAKLRRPNAAFLEVHIEQGPVLESLAQTTTLAPTSLLGVVETIVGQSRLDILFRGQANHAGTTPMPLRHDALAAAAEWIVAVETLAGETPGLAATVGKISAEPGAANVIPGTVCATLDVRHADDSIRQHAVERLLANAEQRATARGIQFTSCPVLQQPAVQTNPTLVQILERAVTLAGHRPHRMPSGAGHDAMVLAPVIPSAMLFIPSPGGLSHHPDESVVPEDVEAALDTLIQFVQALCHDQIFRNA